MAFGGGMRFCVGTDFTKLQMAVVLHSLVTKYRYELVIVVICLYSVGKIRLVVNFYQVGGD